MIRLLNTIWKSLLVIACVSVLNAPYVWADNADVAIYREQEGGELVTTAGTQNQWDTIVREDTSSYTLVGGATGSNIDLQAGHYVVMYSIRWDDASGSRRTGILTNLELAGTDLAIGRSMGYIRRTNSADQSYTTGGGIINVASDGDDLIVESIRRDASSGFNTAARVANTSGVMLLKLDDDWDYLRLTHTGTFTAPTTATWTDVTYDSQDEIDANSFAHSGGDITLKAAGHYLVFANTYFGTTDTTGGTGPRTEFRQRLTLDGTPVEGSVTTVYIRGNQQAERIQEGAASLGMIIETSTAGEVLNVEVDEQNGNIQYEVNQDRFGNYLNGTSLTIVKLPDDADYIRLEDGDTDDLNPENQTDLGWGLEPEEDLASFTHPSPTAPGSPDSAIEVEVDDDYLFLTSNYTDNETLSRVVWTQYWHVNDGVVIPYGWTGGYNRNSGANDTGNWSGMIFDSLEKDDYIEAATVALGNFSGGDPIENDDKGLQGLRIGSLFIEVSGSSNLMAGTEVQCSVDGTLQTETTAVASSTWTVKIGKPVPDNSIITCFVPNATDDNESTAVALYDGTDDITGMVLNQKVLTIGSNQNDSFTIADLGLYDNDDDEDIMHSANGGVLNVDDDDVYTDDELEIKSGNTLTVGGTQGIIGHDADLNGTLSLTGTMVMNGSWDSTGGTFLGSTSTVIFTGTMSETITSASESFDELIFNDSLVGYWRFDEANSGTCLNGGDACDSSGYGNDGTWTDTTSALDTIPTDTNFANTHSIDLDGSNDSVNVGSHPSLDLVQNFTVAAWVRGNSFVNFPMVFCKGTVNTEYLLFANTSASNRFLFRVMRGGFNNVQAATSAQAGVWQHVAGVYDGSFIRIYVNGVEDATPVALTGDADTFDTDLHIGTCLGNNFEWNGLIDDARVYNRALSASEIFKLGSGNGPETGTGTYSLQDAMDVNGTLWIHTGTVDANGQDINVGGGWQNTGGTFDEETRTVTLDGGDQAIDYSETFYNLTKSVTTAGTLYVGKDSTMGVRGALSLSGVASNLLSVRSSNSGTQHDWNVTAGDQNVSFLYVEDSTASSNDIIATFSVNGTNNDDADVSPHWIFASTFYWVGSAGGDTNDPGNWATAANTCGTGGGAGVPGATDVATFQDNCDNNATVDVNFTVAALDIQTGYAGTITPNTGISIDVNGPYTQAAGTLDLDANDNNLNVQGNFTKTGGTFTAGTGITTFDGALTVDVNAGTDLGNVTISASPDVAVTLGSDVQFNDLTIGAGDSLITDGYEVTIDADLDLNGLLNATNGADGNSIISIAGNWDATSGSFTNTNSTVEFNATSGTSDIISDTKAFYNLEIDDGGGGSLTVELEDALDVNGTLFIKDGTLDTKSGSNFGINIAGSWDNDDTFTPRSGVVTIDGAVPQTIAHGSGTFNTVTVTNTTGTVFFTEAFTTSDLTNESIGSAMVFDHSTTYTISDDLTLTGTTNDLIVLDSNDGSTQFTLDVTAGNQSVSYVSVANSAADSNDILAANSFNNGGNDDAVPPPTDQWIFLAGTPDYMHPDIGAPGMNVVVQFIGSNFREDSTVTTSSANIVIGNTIVTDANGDTAVTGGRVITASFFILPGAPNETVTVTVDGVAVAQKFEIQAVTANDGDFTGDTGTLTLGDGTSNRGDRTKMGAILLDELIIPSGLEVFIDTTDSDGTTAGNQGYMPVIILVDGDVNISGSLNVDGSDGSAGSGQSGGAGGAGGPGGGGGGAGGGDAAAQNDGGAGYSGGGGGSCQTNSASCAEGSGGDGSGQGGQPPTTLGGVGGAAIITSLAGGGGGNGDTGDGASGGGGSGFAFGSSGGGGEDGVGPGSSGSGGGGGDDDNGGGGGGFGEVGVVGGTGGGGLGAVNGNDQLVPFAGGSGGGGGGAANVSNGGGAGGGGGAVILQATGTIFVDGVLMSDGGDGGGGTAGGGAGSGGSIVLQAFTVTTTLATWNNDGGTGGTGTVNGNGGAGGDGRIRVDGVPSGVATIQGAAFDANITQFVGPAITDITTSQVIGTGAASSTIEVHITNGVTSTTGTVAADANGDFTFAATYLAGANYITVSQETSAGSVKVMSIASLGTLTIDISGTSDLTAGTTVMCAQNGGVLTQTDTVSGGTFSITGVNKPDTDDIITCWADGVTFTEESTAVTKYDGDGDISGLVLNRRKLTIGSNENTTLTVANLGQYDNDDDEDVMHTSNSSVLTVDGGGSYDDEELVILLTNELSVLASDTVNTHSLDIDGTLTFTGAAQMNVAGDWDATGLGTWTEGSSIVTFTGTMDQTVTPDGDNFHDLTINNTGGGGTDNVILTGTLDIEDDLTLTNGDLDVNTNDIFITIAGDWTVGASGTFDEGTSTVQFDSTTANQTITSNSQAFYDVHIFNTGTTPDDRIILADDMDINGTLVVQDGDFDLDANAANASIAGNFFIQPSGAMSGGNTTETVTFDGATTQTLTSNSQSFMNLTMANTGLDEVDDFIILTDNLDVDGTLTFNDGNLDADTNSVDITIGIGWGMTATGSFTAGSGSETVTFDGTDQTITGTTAFNNFTKTETTNNGDDVDFTIQESTTQTINGVLTLDGLDVDDRINLTSTGTFFTFNVTAADQNVSLLIVTNSHASSNDIIASASTDNGGTDSGDSSPQWVFSTARYWIGNPNLANTNDTNSWSAVAGACGSGSASVPTSANDVFFTSSCVNSATVDANLNVASFNMQAGYGGTIIPDSGILIDVDGSYTQVAGTLDLSVNNADLRVKSNFTKSGGLFLAGTGTVTIDGVSTVNVNSGTNLGNLYINPDPDGKVTLASDITVDDLVITTGDELDAEGYEITSTDDFTISGTFDVSTGTDGVSTVQVGGGWDATGGSVAHLTSNIRFVSTSYEQISSSTHTFNLLTFDGVGGTWELQDNMDIDNNLSITNGELDAGPGNNTIFLTGNWLNSDSFQPRGGTVVFDGSTDQTVTETGTFFSIELNNTGGGGSDDVIFVNAIDMGGTLVVTDGDLDVNTNNLDINIGGSWLMGPSGSFDGPTSSVTFDGTSADQTILSNGQSFFDIEINNTASAGDDDVFIADALDVNGSIIITDGNLDATTSGASISVERDWIMSVTGSFTAGTSTVSFDGTANDQFITSSADAFYNLEINNTAGGGNDDVILNDDLDVNGTLVFTDGDLDADINDVNIAIAGNWLNDASGSFINGTSTVTFDGQSNVQILTGANTFHHFEKVESVIDGISSTIQFEASVTQTIGGTLTLTGLNNNDRVGLISDNPGTRFTLSVTGTQIVTRVAVRDSQASVGDIHAINSIEGTNVDSGEPSPHWVFIVSGPLRGAVIIVD